MKAITNLSLAFALGLLIIAAGCDNDVAATGSKKTAAKDGEKPTVQTMTAEANAGAPAGEAPAPAGETKPAESDPAPAEPAEEPAKTEGDSAEPTKEEPTTEKAPEAAPAPEPTPEPTPEPKLEGPAETTTPEVTTAKSADENGSDWPMWGGTPGRNMVSKTGKVSLDFDFGEVDADGKMKLGKNVVWQQGLGSQTYGNPIVAGGKVFVGTNNGGGWRKDVYPADQDKGVVLAFNEEDGKFLWQLTRDKLGSGRVNDWLLQGICSVPVIEGDRMWVVTNRCELMCLDTEGFHDDENDGPIKDEKDNTKQDADIIWNLDMIEDMGVFPHNLATSSPVIHGDIVYVVTSNGVDEAHLDVPSPRAPCFLAVNKNTGEVVWEHNQPFDGILHGQWSSPAIGVVNDVAQVIMPGGDGWVYSFEAKTGKELWKCDLNPKDTKWELYGKGTRNSIISTPVFYDNKVFIAVGQDPEHGEGVGYMWCIDATKSGDLSAEVGEIGKKGEPNPNSGIVWVYGGEMKAEEGEEPEAVFRRTMSTAAIHDGMVFIADLSGYVHCVDLETGKRHWEHDMLSGVWGSPLVADGKVFLGNEDGVLTVFKASKEKCEVIAEKETLNYSSIYSTPTFANGRLYLSDRTRLYAIDVNKE